MHIQLVAGSYKSIKSLDWADIPDFVVVTGKNGSGKTQLLELLHYHLGLDPKSKKDQRNNVSSPFYGVDLIVDNCNFSHDEVIFLPATWALGNLGGVNTATFSSTIIQLHQHITGVRSRPSYVELAEIVSSIIDKPKEKITIEDVQSSLPIDHYDYINQIQLHEGLNEASMVHFMRTAELREKEVSTDQIREQLGPAPWDVINKLLDSASFPYKLSRPTSFIGDFQFRLISIDDASLKIDFSDLSSGEKILISLGIWMYNAGKEKRLPKLMLLDEPDAHLHPSGIREFLNVLEKILVRKHDVRVIMSTHSPTTVSFSPEYSLFEMSKISPQIRLLKSKEYGISLLTDGLITVKRNTKYVLVEDQGDANFYNTAFSILKDQGKVNKDIGIIFIPSSNKHAETSGGSSVVKTWVEKFVDEGVFDVFHGLIDRDNDNLSSTNIHVIGRYSLENYLLDPIIVFSSLLHEELDFCIPGIALTHKDEHKIADLTEEELQVAADYILAEVRGSLTGLNGDSDKLEEISFTNGVTLQYPAWLINKRGHDLYEKFRYKFKKPVNPGNLIKALVRQEFIPDDLRAIFSEIQDST